MRSRSNSGVWNEYAELAAQAICTKARFAKVITKAISRPQDDMGQFIDLLGKEHNEAVTDPLFVQRGNHLRAIQTAGIIWVEAEKDYSWIETAQKCFSSNYGIGNAGGKATCQEIRARTPVGNCES